jgi:PAS domain S-box-containing protein
VGEEERSGVTWSTLLPPVPAAPSPPLLQRLGLVPATSPLRERVERLGAALGLALLQEPSGGVAGASAAGPAGVPAGVEVVLVDLAAPGGDRALEAALEETRTHDVLALVGVEPGLLLPAGVDDVVEVAALERELPVRLALARSRRAGRLELQARQRDLALLLELVADYAESLDVEELLHGVTRRLADALGISRASLVLLDGEEGVVVAASDDASLRERRIELARYPEVQEVARTGRPVTVEHAPSHPLLEGVKAQLMAQGIRSIAALPLAVRGRVLGVLLVRAGQDRGAFSARELDFLSTVAHATAVALRNASLVESVRGQTERERTARIAAEERAALLARYEGFFAHVNEGVAILDERACVLSLNPAGARMLELTPQEARGRHVNAVCRPADEAQLVALVGSASHGETAQEVDVAARTAGGRLLTLSLSASPLREGNGVAIFSFRDVTTQRLLADELRHTKDFLERLIDSSVDAIIAADMRGRIILFNKGAEAICGWPASEALATANVEQLYPPGVARDVMRRLRAPEEGGPGRLDVCRQDILTRTGERVPVNMTASILYEGGREVATVGIFTDLRARMQLERQLSDAQSRLAQSEKNAVIVALAGTAAHELNQPLTSVMGYAELLKRRMKQEDPAYRPVDIIYREAERMAEIVRKIGKITRYETKAYIGQARIVDLDKASSHDE